MKKRSFGSAVRLKMPIFMNKRCDIYLTEDPMSRGLAITIFLFLAQHSIALGQSCYEQCAEEATTPGMLSGCHGLPPCGSAAGSSGGVGADASSGGTTRGTDAAAGRHAGDSCGENGSWVLNMSNKTWSCRERTGGERELDKTDGSPTYNCERAIHETRSTCNGLPLQSLVPQLQRLSTMANNNTTINGQCQSVANVNAIAGGASLTMIAMCMDAEKRCNDICSKAASSGGTPVGKLCGGHFLQMSTAGISAVYSFLTSKQAHKCAEQTQQQQCTGAQIASNPTCQAQYCSSPMAVNDPMCTTAFCSVPAHQGNPVCSTSPGGLTCASPTMASSAMCACVSNPTSAACLQAQNSTNHMPGGGTLGGNGSIGNPEGSMGALQDEPTLPDGKKDPTGKDNSRDASVIPQNAGGGGGGGGNGSGGGFPGGGGGAGGRGDPEKEVALGVQNGGAMDPSLAGGAGGGDGGADRIYGGGSRGAGDGGGPSIPNFAKLFGGLGNNSGGRAPASANAELLKHGITPANGLSNWEKVTRKMNEKAASLLP